MGKIQFLSPEGFYDPAHKPIAPRLPDLNGKVIGLVHNGKPGSTEILTELEELLRRDFKVKNVVFRKKRSPGLVNEHFEEMADMVDVAICGVGD